ncbi:hypothetical protein [Burkholderia gladioli]|uniref:hypothetical protein n=1 Tax=Burkholderia gladioli TaxID=28095 RepID=UPI003D252200
MADRASKEDASRRAWADASEAFGQAKHLFAAITETDDFDRMAALAHAGQQLMAAAELRAEDMMMGRAAEANHG